MLSFKANKEQARELRSLGYWISESAYLRERCGGDDTVEAKRVSDTIHFIFDRLDALGVPFWVQNAVVNFAENWRRYQDEYISDHLRRERNIYGV